MKKLLGFVCAIGVMFGAMPASAAMVYVLGGTFSGKLTTHLSTTPVTHDFSGLDLVFAGLSDGTAPTMTTVRGVDIYAFGLSDLIVTDGPDQIDLPNFSFVVAPSIDLIGFSGPQGLLFSVTLPTSFDGTSLYVPTNFSDIVASQAFTAGNRKLKLNHVDGANGVFLAFDSALLGVPESATWAMFILGFGAVGAGLRRRRMSGTTIA